MNQPQPILQGQPLFQAPPRRPSTMSRFKARMMQRYGIGLRPEEQCQLLVLPSWLTTKSVVFFFVAFLACTIVWQHPMEGRYALISILSVLLFFSAGVYLSKSWARKREKDFLRNLFWSGFAVHLLWVCYCYFFLNPEYYGTVYGETADVEWYMPYAKDIAAWLAGDFDISLGQLMNVWRAAIDDTGYPMWLAIEYVLVDGASDVFVTMVVKCIVSTYCAISIYHVAKRHFGIGTARYAALFVAFNPNMIYWCGNMFKEAEMVFLCCVFVDKMDEGLTSGNLSFRTLWPGLLAGLSLFFFRGALGIVAFLSLFTHIVFVSRRVLSTGKKVLAGVLVAITLLVGMGDRLRTEVNRVTTNVQTNEQQANMEWRAKRSGGNAFAKYATATVFAPLIVTIPFPTFNVSNKNQILQMQLSGGSYIKNIFSFFVILVMFLMLISGEWRKHVFILAYTLGYLATLALSHFAQSGRFHMPIWPMLMLLAAYGIQIANGNARIRRGFTWVLLLEVVACLAWNWFKLRGRGLI